MPTRTRKTKDGRTRHQQYEYIGGVYSYIGTYDSEDEAQVAGAQAVAQDRAVRRRGATLSSFREDWLSRIYREPNTLADYRLSIVRVEDAIGDVRLASITDATMDDIVRKLDALYSPSTIRKTIKDLRRMLRAAQRKGLIAMPNGEPPSPESMPEVKKPPVDPLTRKQVDAIIKAAPDYWRPLFSLAADSGMRRGELLGVRECDFDFTEGSVSIRQQVKDGGRLVPYGKTAAAYRTIYLPARTIAALKAHRPAPNPYGLMFPSVRGKVQHESNFSRRVVRDVFDKAGIPAGDGLHLLRHTYASVLAKNGCQAALIQSALGHEDPSTSLIYTHMFKADAHLVAAAMESWGKNGTQERRKRTLTNRRSPL